MVVHAMAMTFLIYFNFSLLLYIIPFFLVKRKLATLVSHTAFSIRFSSTLLGHLSDKLSWLWCVIMWCVVIDSARYFIVCVRCDFRRSGRYGRRFISNMVERSDGWEISDPFVSKRAPCSCNLNRDIISARIEIHGKALLILLFPPPRPSFSCQVLRRWRLFARIKDSSVCTALVPIVVNVI